MQWLHFSGRLQRGFLVRAPSTGPICTSAICTAELRHRAHIYTKPIYGKFNYLNYHIYRICLSVCASLRFAWFCCCCCCFFFSQNSQRMIPFIVLYLKSYFWIDSEPIVSHSSTFIHTKHTVYISLESCYGCRITFTNVWLRSVAWSCVYICTVALWLFYLCHVRILLCHVKATHKKKPVK